jgi:hypothetical protein
MQPIAATLNPGDTGPQVANLQDALRLLLDRSVIRSLEPPNSPTTEELAKLGQRLARERAQSTYGSATQRLVLFVQLQEGLGDGLGGAVEETTARRLNEILTGLGAFDATQGPVVRGTVRDANGNPVPGVIVRAIDRDLRHWELLGRPTVTKERGSYEIPYAAKQSAHAESGGPDIQIQAFDSDALDRLLAESAVMFNAGSEATIDITLPDATTERPSDFEIELAQVKRHLKGQADDGSDLAIVDLTDADIQFLAADTGIDRQHLAWLRTAHQTGVKVRHELGAAACYGWFRKEVDANIEALRTRAPSELRRLLVGAIDESIVPASLRPAIESILDSIGHANWAAVKGLLSHSGLPDAAARTVAQLLDSIEAIDDVTLRGFAQSGVLEKSHADRLGLAASLSRLTDASAPAVAQALGRTFDSLGGRGLNKSGDLARLTHNDWVNVLNDTAARIPDGSNVDQRATELEEACMGAYPTIGMIHRAIRAGSEDSAALATVVSRNQGVDLLSLDLTTDSDELANLDLGTLNEVQRKGVMTELRTMQRVLAVAKHPTLAQKLKDGGYHHATRIALATQAELAEKAGIAEGEAIQILGRARTASLQAVHAWMAVRDAQMDRLMINGVGSTSYASMAAAQITRWEGLFGSADYCDCDHCQSVLGPGAYFVDLMHYIERFILKPSENVPAHMQLATRRKDLWEDKLISCKATDEIVPTLDIVNELLERWITRPSWSTPLEIHRGIADPASSPPSFGLPVNFALERLEILLAHFGLSRDRVVQMLGGTGQARIQSRLKTWPSELRLIQEARADDATAAGYFEALYRTNANLPNGPGRLDQVINSFSLSELQVATTLDRDVLRMLVLSGFVSPDGSTVPAVGVTLTATPGAVQNTIEIVSNLTRRRLDRLHRLVRLWRKLPWTVPELDYALKRLAPAGGTAELGDTTLQSVVDLLDLADTTGFAFEEVMALWDEIPREGFRGKASLFDRRFNAEPFSASSGRWPAAMPPDLPLPLTATSTAATDSRAARLLSALQMNESDFAELIEWLKNVEIPDPISPVRLVTLTGTVPTSLRLSERTLPVLYRHALLRRVLKVKPAELLRLVRLTPEIASRATATQPLDRQWVANLADVVSLQKFIAWQRSSGFSSEDLVWLIDATRRPETEPDAAEVASRAIKRIAADRLVVFPATLFTATGLSEQQSREAMAGLEGSAVERPVVQPSRPAGAATNESAPQEAEYRLKSGLTDQALEDFVAEAIRPWVFDVAQVAVFGLARHLGEFDDTAFTRLFLTSAQSVDLVRQNLDDGAPGGLRRPFVVFKTRTVPRTTRYRLNPEYFSANRPAPLVPPGGPTVRPMNLAGTILLGFLKMKAQEIAQPDASAARTVPDTLFTEIFLSEQQSRWLVAFNPDLQLDQTARELPAFLPDPANNSRILNVKGIARATKPLVLDDILRTVRLRAVELLRAFDPLAVADRAVGAEVGVTPEMIGALRQASAAVQASLGGVQPVDPAEVFGDLSPPATAATLIGQLQRLKRLFAGSRFDAPAVRFIVANWTSTSFAGPAGVAIDIERLKAVAAYARWLRLPEQPSSDTPDPKHAARRNALNAVVAASTTPADAQLAKVLDATEGEIRSLKECAQIWTGKWHEQLDRAAKALEITRRLGVGGRALVRIGGFDSSNAVDDLFKAADDIYGAFRAKYTDEKTYREKSEAFEDVIRGKRRDALVAFISANDLGLRTSSQMYAHFLIDVQVGGCARTSRLVAAISSLQLFVHRVLMGLEGDLSDPDRRYRFGTTEAREQWYWRKNYRVWEANRKVFLFPENFIEPDIRDDKTPLFRSLEDELLQRRITTAEAEESYRNYLTGYSEVAGLKIVGAFHDVQRGRDLGNTEKEAADKIFIDVLHLVGVTADDPPIHYLRRIGNVERSRGDDGASYPIQFSPWEKLSAQIPVQWVSPVVYQRKLRLFWNELTTVSTTRRLKEGTYFDGYKHRFKVKWIEQKPTGGWMAPQEITFADRNGLVRKAADDPLTFTLSIDLLDAIAAGYKPAVPQFIRKRVDVLLPLLDKGQSEVAGVPVNTWFGVWGNLVAQVFTTGSASIPLFRAAPRTQLLAWNEMRHHGEAEDDFTVNGWNWERVFPAIRIVTPVPASEELQVSAMNSEIHGFVPAYGHTVALLSDSDIATGKSGLLAAHLGGAFGVSDRYLYFDQSAPTAVGNHHWESTKALFPSPMAGLRSWTTTIATFDRPVSDALAVNRRAVVSAPNSQQAVAFRPSCIVESDDLRALFTGDGLGVNLGTDTAPLLLGRLAVGGLPGLLDKEFQGKKLVERRSLVANPNGPITVTNGAKVDFGGAYGTYLREIFFHVPFLVANHLNSQQRFEDSQNWYHYIFNPMAPDGPWRYREFVNRPVESLREALTDRAALIAYRNDPFNPHAIARLRLSAYQKSIVMKYIDNLLDWGDRLFTQFTMESVNEAMMLYILAADILGERPTRLPKCREEEERSYDDIKPSLSDVSDFLIEEMEQLTLAVRGNVEQLTLFPEEAGAGQGTVRAAFMATTADFGDGDGAPIAGGEPGLPLPSSGGTGVGAGRAGYWSSTTGQPLAELYQTDAGQPRSGFTTLGTDSVGFVTPPIDFEGGSPGGGGFLGGDLSEDLLDTKGLIPGKNLDIDITYTLHDVPPPMFTKVPRNINPVDSFDPIELVPAKSIFCFPVNKELLAYHDRVQDRLAKIRNCMDIAGVRRRLALFAPEIDPRLLVRMKAAGLSLDDVLDSTSGHAPPYRFTFLLERARQYAATVQSLGAQLLSAIEKRDAEELAVLRTVHEQHLLDLRTQMTRMEIDAANDALAGLQRQKEAAELRQQHYDSLLAGGLIPSEQAQQALGITASALTGSSGVLHLIAAIGAGIPQMNVPAPPSPTQASTGGLSANALLSSIAAALGSAASVADGASRLAGTKASFERRAQDWKFQGDVARKDVAQLAKQIEAAEIRVAIAERALEVHQKSIDQTREIFDFYRSKFSSHGLYTWLSTQLNRYHRVAFDAAWNMARMVEKALHFERPELRETVFLSASGWSPERAGLLSGESLLLDLQRLEASYLLTNTRQIEVEQSFSLAQYYPDKLIDLRQTGECDFDIPEFLFDLSYPGHYFRRIKAVRLSIPCVIGPHASVGATLRMTRNHLRDAPEANKALTEVPLRHAPTIAASTAQGDAGIFEFNFRDERLLPFEGMGAISSWNLRLPKEVRPFKYDTISDIILRISYTAREDGALRENVDRQNGAIFTRLRDAAPRVALSLRCDFPTVWARFQQAPAVSGRFALSITLTEMHYPFWLRERFADEENVGVEVVFARSATDGGNVRLSDGAEELLQPSTGVRRSRVFTAGKTAISGQAESRDLSLSFNRKDMSDVIIVLAPVGQA